MEKSSGGIVERTGQRLVKLLAAIFIGGLIILMARAVQWRELAKLVSGEAARAAANPVKKEAKKDAKTSEVGSERSSLAKADAPSSSVDKTKHAAQNPSSQERSLEIPPQEMIPTTQASLNLRQVVAQSAPVLPPVPSELVLLRSNRAPKIILPAGAAPNPTIRSTSIARGQKQGIRTGSLEITSNTAARIYLDGQFSGWTPRIITLTAGNHKIRLMAEGYEDWSRTLSLKTLDQVNLTAAMEKKPESLLGR